MTTYVIGDVQGCFDALERLLTAIHFDSSRDILWFTGDLVNRGPQSLEVLRFIKTLGEARQKTVLGNHDLHLLAVAYGVRELHHDDTLQAVLAAPDRNELMDWLRHRPLLYEDKNTGFVLTHAGLAPAWSLKQARLLAQEVEAVLRGNTPAYYLKQMYGNQPDLWEDRLTGIERLRCITNYLTRMRLCHPDGRLELSYKGRIDTMPPGLIPWFDVPDRANSNVKILFGHWAALGGKADVSNVYPLDTGCVWGNCLTAMRLEDEKRFTVKCG